MNSIRHTFYEAALMAGFACFLLAAQAAADQVILDDLIVGGSACIGQDCVNGESFGFDTIRIKENNLRIKAQDTSSSASFPTNDWQITFNDTSNGGANKFSIDDIDGGRTPFTIEAGAPSHSLYVDDGGRLGFGTATPVVDLHVKSGNTPTLRLEQDGTSGFTPQTWDVAGNEANFFVRDATNGSTLPFKIFPGAPTNALTIEASTGDIGVGTASPTAPLHVTSGDQITDMKLASTSAGGSEWEVQSQHRHWHSYHSRWGDVRFHREDRRRRRQQRSDDQLQRRCRNRYQQPFGADCWGRIGAGREWGHLPAWWLDSCRLRLRSGLRAGVDRGARRVHVERAAPAGGLRAPGR